MSARTGQESKLSIGKAEPSRVPMSAGVRTETDAANKADNVLSAEALPVGADSVEKKVPVESGASPTVEPTGPTDESLALRLRDGDSAAGEVLVNRYYPLLIRYLRRLAGSDHMAEELHQQTWVSVLDHLDRFDPASTAGGFKAWLYRIAANKTHDHWRSKGREKNATEGLKLVTEESLPAAEARLEGTEQHHKLKRAIEMLPEAQKQVVMLRYYSDMKFVDIAKMLGCPLNTALGRMHKATLKLRQFMEAD